MFRRWQKEAVNKYRSLESFNTFLSRLTPLNGHEVLGTCDPADLYSVLSVLHSKDRQPQLQVNQCPSFYYFLANAVQPEGEAVLPPVGVEETVDHGGDTTETSPTAADRVRREAVVPISSKSAKLTMDLLSKFFKLEAHPNVTHILLAIVDDDGSVSLVRVFNYLQPPFEGPETLPPLEADGAGAGDDSDDG